MLIASVFCRPSLCFVRAQSTNERTLSLSSSSPHRSNTREKLPYEADGFITGGTRHSTQKDSTWQRHSSKVQPYHNEDPTAVELPLL